MDKEKKNKAVKAVGMAKAAAPGKVVNGKKSDVRLRYNKAVEYGNYTLQLYRKAVWDNEKGRVIDLDYIAVRAAGEHFVAEIYEHCDMFHYLKELVNEDKTGEFTPYIVMLCRNIHFVSTSADSYFHNVVSLASSVSIEPLILKEGFEMSENVSNVKFMEALKSIREKWIAKRAEELAAMKEASDGYSEEDARADAAAEVAEEELRGRFCRGL